MADRKTLTHTKSGKLITHGLSGYAHGCGCETCREALRLDRARRRKEVREGLPMHGRGRPTAATLALLEERRAEFRASRDAAVVQSNQVAETTETEAVK